MRFMLSLACVLSTFALFGTAQQTNPKAPDEKPNIAWEPEFDAALAKAKQEGRPLLIAFLMDGEPANEETSEKIYTNLELIKLSRKFVCVPCCAGDKTEKDGKSARFAGVTIAQQNANEKKARARYLKSDVVCTPQHVFCDPKGTELLRKIYYVSTQQLKKAMALALVGSVKEIDPETRAVVQDEKAKVDKLLKDLDSKNLEVRDAALSGLGTADDARALPAVLGKAKAGNDDATRSSAIKALGHKGNHTAVKPLLPFLADPRAPIVIQVAQTLGVIQIPDAEPDLLSLLKKEKRDRVRSTLLRAVAKCNPGNPKLAELCLATLKGASAQMQAATIVAMGFLKPDTKVTDALRPLLADKNQNMRALGAWALGNQGGAANAELLDKLAKDDKAPEVRELATKASKQCRGERVNDYENLYVMFFFDYEN